MGSRLQRDPDDVPIFPSIRIVVGDTDAEAREIEAINHERDHPFEDALGEMSRWFGWHDFSQYDLDDPFPVEALTFAKRAYQSRAAELTAKAALHGWSLREAVAANRSVRSGDFVGSPATVADQLQRWWESKACDGFIIGADHPTNFARILDEVVPILQERGIFRSRYEAETLRGNLGLPSPPNRTV